MQFEIVIIAVIIIFVLNYTGRINTNKFISDNTEYFRKLKEDDWDFLVKARYGDGVNPDILFTKRIQNAGIVLVLCLFIFISNFSYATFLVSLIAAYLMFKSGYSSMKKYYKRHLNEIDLRFRNLGHEKECLENIESEIVNLYNEKRASRKR